VIPETLQAWTLEAIEALLAQGVFESDRFDFKEMLPHNKAEPDKLRLRKACAAFGNSDGGFFIFGVKDNKGLAPADRIVGLDPALDFPVQFGNFPSGVEPSVEWLPRNPAIHLENNRLVHVVHVPPSTRRPHGVIDDERWWFCKRTSKGTEAMSYEEVRLSFQDTENRRTKLALLSSELSHIAWVAERLLRELPDNASTDGLVNDWAWMTRYPTTVIDTILGDAYSLFADKTDIQLALASLRDETRRSNEVGAVYSNYTFIRSTADPQRVRLHSSGGQPGGAIPHCVPREDEGDAVGG
jgi:hypothetical protein